MKRVKRVQQQESYDCGAAALYSIADWFGISTTFARCRKACGCMQDGVTIQGIISGAKGLGLNAKGFTSQSKEMKPLEELTTPVIAHITTEEGMYHFVVICRVTGNKVTFMDPAKGDYRTLARTKFASLWNGHIITFAKADKDGKYTGERVLVWRVFASILKNHTWGIAKALTFSAILVLIGISNSLFLKELIDTSLPVGDKGLLKLISMALFILIILSATLGYGRTAIMLGNSLKIDLHLVLNYIRKIFSMPAQFFNEYTTGEISSRIEDAFKIRILISEGLVSLFISASTLAVASVLMFTCYNRLALLLFASIPFYALIYLASSRLGKRYNRDLAHAGAQFESRLLDSLKGASTIKHYGAERITTERIEESYRNVAQKIRMSGTVTALLTTASASLSSGIMATIIAVGGYAVIGGELTVGELVAFYTMSTLFTSPINELIGTNSIITAATVSAERLFEIMQLEGEDDPAGRGEMPKICNNTLELKNISFSYTGRPELFRGLNATFRGGCITALTGANGSGKSTLAQIIMRDLEPQSGTITLGGTESRKFPLKVWRREIALISQHTQLFNTTLAENITCGDNPPNSKALAAALLGAGLERLIERLPLGLMTNTGECGVLFSGGEIQKIAIARMLYRNPKVIIFDESTSSMDSESESCIMETMFRLKKRGATIIMITHKSGNLGHADENIPIGSINNVH